MRPWWAFQLVVLMAACDSATAPRSEGPVVFVGVVPGEVTVRQGSTVQLDAVTLGSGHRLLHRTVTWSSSNPDLATVSQDGLVQTLTDGVVEITASAEGVRGAATVTIDSRVAASIALSPDSVQLLPGRSLQFRTLVLDSVGAEIRNRQIEWASSHPSVVRVHPSGQATAVGHDAIVTITASVDEVSAQAIVHVPPDPCRLARSIAAGESVTALLQASDCRLDGGQYAGRWRLDVGATTALRIDLESRDFDAYLILTDLSGNTIEVDDDSGAGRNARISGPIPAGSYIVWATSYDAGRMGEYVLSISTEQRGRCEPVHPIAVGQSVVGYLSVLDCRYSTGQYVDRWRFDLASPATIRALMQSGAVDSWLTLTDLQGNTILWDDDSGGGRNAAIATTLPAGSYILWASSRGAGERGRYTLSLAYEQVAWCRSTQPIHRWSDAGGFLTSNDCRLDSGRYADRWRLDLSQAGEIRIDLMSSNFDAYVLVTDLDGRMIASAADGGSGTNARLDVRLERGSYIVWATSWFPGRTGAYHLSVR